ncbi:MAG TPA: Holliday junction resolvase RuvX [candidate division Zixibacteria bacterium]|nr:Holliday junction resolvase RuvX [candidate division Zixibacteria bacterium]
MALDLGEKRIGVALSDPSRTIAAGYGAVKRTSRQSDYEKLGNIAKENDVDLIIVGLPIPLSGQEGTRAAWARDYASALGSALGIPFKLWDEALTTVDAEASLRARGYNAKRRREMVDSVAAAFILQSYLDSILNEVPSRDYDEI